MCMRSGFPETVEPSSQSLADVERSQYKATWHETLEVELDGHQTTGACEGATLPQGRKPVCPK